MSRGIKIENQYQHLFENYDKIPKSVFAAVCASLILMNHDEDLGVIEEEFQAEWEKLYMNQIIPQRPRNWNNIPV